MSREVRGQIFYLIRRGWYGQLLSLCETVSSSSSKGREMLFWKAFAYGSLGNLQGVESTLDGLSSRHEFRYPQLLAQMTFRQRLGKPDTEGMRAMNNELSALEGGTQEMILMLAARFHLYTGNLMEAQRLASYVQARGHDAPETAREEAEAVLGWCVIDEIITLGETDEMKLHELVHSYGSQSQISPDLLMLAAHAAYHLKRRDDFLSILTRTISIYSNFTPALADKALFLGSNGNWEQSLDLAQRLLDIQSDHLDALTLIAIHAFTQDGHLEDAVTKFETLYKILSQRESNSVEILMNTVMLFKSICGRHPSALQFCQQMIQIAMTTAKKLSNDLMANVLCESGDLYLLQGIIGLENAQHAYTDAMKEDESNVRALLGLIRSHIMESAVEDAENQLELLAMVHNIDELGYDVTFLQALVSRSKLESPQEVLLKLSECKKQFIGQNKLNNDVLLARRQLGLSHTMYLGAFQHLLENYNPEVSMSMALDFFSVAEPKAGVMLLPPPPSVLTSETVAMQSEFNADSLFDDDAEDTESMSIATEEGIELLQRVQKKCPGMIAVYLELGRAYVSVGMYTEAHRVLQQGLTLHSRSSAILVSLALVEVVRGMPEAAQRLLDQALAFDFSARQRLRFRLATAIVHSQRGKLNEALPELEAILASPEFSDAGPSLSSAYWDAMRLTEDDRVLTYICQADTLAADGRISEAQKVLQAGRVAFAGSPRLPPLLFASARIYVRKRDFDSAQRCLDQVDDSSPCYAQACSGKAKIAWFGQHDRETFLKIHRELAKHKPSAKSFAMLGDAYLRIPNPELSIDAYMSAYQMEPTNSALWAKIGRSIVAMHEYHRAVEFYETVKQSIQDYGRGPSGGNAQAQSLEAANLSHDFAELLLKLNRVDPAQRVLRECLYDTEDPALLKQNVTTYLLLAKAQKPMDAVESLKRALDTQRQIVTHARTLSSSGYADELELERAGLSQIGSALGVAILKAVGNQATGGEALLVEAHDILQDALAANPHNTDGLLTLARIHFLRGDLDAALSLTKRLIGLVTPYLPMCFTLPASLDAVIEDAYRVAAGHSNSAAGAASQARAMGTAGGTLAGGVAGTLAGGTLAGGTMIGSTLVGTLAGGTLAGGTLLGSTLAGGSRQKRQHREGGPIGIGQGPLACPCPTFPILLREAPFPLGHMPNVLREAVVLASDLCTIRGRPDDALSPLLAYQSRVPFDYPVLDRLVAVLQRVGKLTEGEIIFSGLEKLEKRCVTHPGYQYCLGVFSRAIRDPVRALYAFAKSSLDPHWAEASTVQMIELYLNPDQESILEESETPAELPRENIAAAEDLLRGLKERIGGDPVHCRVLEAQCQLASRTKVSLERACDILSEILGTNPDCLSAIRALASTFLAQQNPQKARNVLKRIGRLEQPTGTSNSVTSASGNTSSNTNAGESLTKAQTLLSMMSTMMKGGGEPSLAPSTHHSLPHNLFTSTSGYSTLSDYLSAMLLLTKLSLDQNKASQALDCLQRILLFFPASSAAWTLCAQVAERKQEFDLAAQAYRQAWEMDLSSSASSGYKLAFALMKCGKYVEAVDVAEKVLSDHPDYPRMREEILVPSLLRLRTTNTST